MINEQFIFILIVFILCINYVTENYLSYLNISSLRKQLPTEAEGIYNSEQYNKSQHYLLHKTKLQMLASFFSFVIILLFLFYNGFAYIDNHVKNITQHYILQSLIFFAILGFISDVVSTPFEIYSIFHIEEKYGFNKTTPKIYITDKIKLWILAVIIGGSLLFFIVWIYHISGKLFVPIALAVFSLYSIFMSLFYTQLIVPLFNKLKPLEEGELKNAIVEFTNKANFPLSKIFVIDSSKRSLKSNAYFSGLGKKKRIILFDTLIEKHNTEELLAILSHEIGHYRKKHIIISLLLGLMQIFVMLFLLYLFLQYHVFQYAIGISEPSFHSGLIVFGLIYLPFSVVFALFSNYISRRNEFAADAFTGKYSMAEPLCKALKKLSADNLSNLTPHPAYVFFYYSHPPLLKRLYCLQKIISGQNNNLS